MPFEILAQGKITKPQNVIKSNPQPFLSKPDGEINGYSYVDLGLPSGTKWAIYNVGANEPQDYGDYFSWGDRSSKNKFKYDDSPLYKVSIEDISGSQYDVAKVKWGDNWQIPTNEDWEELINYCRKYSFKYNGIEGFLFVGKNKHSIFFPAAGEGNSNSWKGIDGRFWTATADHKYDNIQGHPIDGYATGIKIEIQFDKVIPLINTEFRGSGLSIRPVLR